MSTSSKNIPGQTSDQDTNIPQNHEIKADVIEALNAAPDHTMIIKDLLDVIESQMIVNPQKAHTLTLGNIYNALHTYRDHLTQSPNFTDFMIMYTRDIREKKIIPDESRITRYQESVDALIRLEIPNVEFYTTALLYSYYSNEWADIQLLSIEKRREIADLMYKLWGADWFVREDAHPRIWVAKDLSLQDKERFADVNNAQKEMDLNIRRREGIKNIWAQHGVILDDEDDDAETVSPNIQLDNTVIIDQLLSFIVSSKQESSLRNLTLMDIYNVLSIYPFEKKPHFSDFRMMQDDSATIDDARITRYQESIAALIELKPQNLSFYKKILWQTTTTDTWTERELVTIEQQKEIVDIVYALWGVDAVIDISAITTKGTIENLWIPDKERYPEFYQKKQGTHWWKTIPTPTTKKEDI